MMKKTIFVRLAFTLLFLFFLSVVATKPCARFEFPTLKGKVFSAEENTTVSLPFRLDTANCSTKTNFTVGVSKNKHLSILCQLRHLNERCKSGTPVCVCPEEDGLYRFQKTVERTDSATWNWWTSDNLTENTKLTFDVTCKY
ncbi:hypothetical protein BaRGS_00029146 [Batillaria attramentaria]|uniref:Uncharacterized protein n=1 Tax=Batillaria attramentaria TaxID=370345 RepID=A0ABD0JY18_9CAEN